MFQINFRRTWRLGLIGPVVLLMGCGGGSARFGSVDLAEAQKSAQAKGVPAGFDPERGTRGLRKRGARGRMVAVTPPGRPVGRAANR
jgi:hypothetical protein